MPEIKMRIKFESMRISQTCKLSKQKIHINWKEREEVLRNNF
jgi:hypothetical protein